MSTVEVLRKKIRENLYDIMRGRGDSVLLESPLDRHFSDVLKEFKTETNQGVRCTSCNAGTYQETRLEDDWDGKLHCTNCGAEVPKYPKKNAPVPEPKKEFKPLEKKGHVPHSLNEHLSTDDLKSLVLKAIKKQ